MANPLYFFQKIRDLAYAVALDRVKLAALSKLEPQVLAAHQEKRLRILLRYAAKRSRFYQEQFKGLDLGQIPLRDLPILTKQSMLQNYDHLATDSRLKIDALQIHLNQLQQDQYYKHGYKIFRSSGSSGNPTVMAYHWREWARVLAQIIRSSKDCVPMHLRKRLRGANIYARTPSHDSIRISQSFEVGFHEVRYLPVDTPLAELIQFLNDFQPNALNGYPSIITELAYARLAGSLNIHPEVIFLGSEPLTPQMRSIIRKAFGCEPYDQYGTTEAIIMASECPAHDGLHLQEDSHLIEIVDQNNRPVGPGEEGFKVLVTNLYSFTQPIIRYEVSDMVVMHENASPCACGNTFRRIKRITGRNEDLFQFRNSSGKEVVVHLEQLRNVMEEVPNIRQYQIIRRPDEIVVHATLHRKAEANHTRDHVIKGLSNLLQQVQVKVNRISCQVVEEIERNQAASQKFRQIICLGTRE